MRETLGGREGACGWVGGGGGVKLVVWRLQEMAARGQLPSLLLLTNQSSAELY